MSSETVPEYFQGFGVDKAENWDQPKLVKYKHKPLKESDVVVKVECCGLCGSDIHTVKGAWGPLNRNDLVVGHEIVGHVTWIGENVKSVKIGQRVGIGAQCNCCTECESCRSKEEHHCDSIVSTYNWPDASADNYITQGGYANYSIAHETNVFPIPENIPSVYAAPLMCGGLTVFSPLVRTIGSDAKNKTVGIIGIGGLGHMAIQFAAALGANVVAFSRTSSKKEQALAMGASRFIATTEEDNWAQENNNTFDMILNCATSFSNVDFDSLLGTLKANGTFATVGAPDLSEKIEVMPFSLIMKNRKIAGSMLGNRVEALKMLEIAAAKEIRPWIEEVPINEKNCGKALTRCDEGDVRYRFVFTNFDKVFDN